jgi:hypothetical protein
MKALWLPKESAPPLVTVFLFDLEGNYRHHVPHGVRLRPDRGGGSGLLV